MGKTQSKEEVIIAQAGNSGGETNGQSGFTTKNIMEIVSMLLVLIIIGTYIYEKCKKKLAKKINRQIRASQEL
jgi:hypothetical protein